MANIVGCECSGEKKNTGYLGQQLFGIKQMFFIVPILAADGTRNSLDLTESDLGTELLGKVNHSDPTKRWYPIQEMEQFTPAQEDTQFETANSGLSYFLRKGIKSEAFELWGQSAQFFSRIKEICYDFGIIGVDNCGNVRGYKETPTSTVLYPRPVNAQSWDAKFMDRTDAAVSRIMVGFQFKRIDDHAKLWLVPSSAFGSNNPLELKGMVDVNLEATPVTSTTVTVQVNGLFGNALQLIPIKGLVAVDFSTTNLTAGGAVTIDTVVESSSTDGEYLITFDSAPTTSDVLKIDAFKAATGAQLQGFEGTTTAESL